jgi:acyl-CoA thioester hydrolase
MDVYGHVNNSRFLTLYEEARVALMFTKARAAGLTSFEEGVVIARHEIDYLRQVDYGDTVRIELWIEELRASRFTIGYELFADGPPAASGRSDEWSGPYREARGPDQSQEPAFKRPASGTVASRARSVLVPFDLAAGRPRRLSDAEREFLAPWQP